jgi:hypothetical protein
MGIRLTLAYGPTDTVIIKGLGTDNVVCVYSGTFFDSSEER